MTGAFVVGLGSFHGDDQAGWMVLEELRKLGFSSDRLKAIRNPAELLDTLESAEELTICDACLTDDRAGVVSRFRWPSDRLIYQRGRGSHDLSLHDALLLRQELGMSPSRVDVWVIAGKNWSAHIPPSVEIQTAASTIAARIWRETMLCSTASVEANKPRMQ